MARVYTHMPLRNRILDFSAERLREIEEEQLDLQNELDLLAAIREAAHEDDYIVHNHCAVCSDEIRARLSDLEAEARVWPLVRQRQNVCTICNGWGTLNKAVEYDHTIKVPCESCNGTGLGSVAEVATAGA